MKINHKIVTTVLRWTTLTIFAVALGFKLYNIYKYGGTKASAPVNPNDGEQERDYPEVSEYPYPEQTSSYAYAQSEAPPVNGYNEAYGQTDKTAYDR